MPRRLGPPATATALALILAAALPARAEDAAPAADVPAADTPAPEVPAVAPPLPPPLATPEQAETKTLGDWSLEVYKLPSQQETLCVISRSYPSGDKLGFLVGNKGRGLLYGRPDMKVPEGATMDFGFSVDGRPPLGLRGGAYDPNTIMSAPLPSPEGEKLLAAFTRGKQAVIGSNDLKVRSEPLDLGGAGAAVAALDACAKDNAIKVAEIPAGAVPAVPTPPPAPGATVPGGTFTDQGFAGSGGMALPAPSAAPAAPAPEAPAAPAAEAPATPPAAAPEPLPEPPTAAQSAIRDAIASEAKKRNAGVGYAVAMPKDVTGDKKDDIVLLFVLLEGKDRHGYATVLKTVGADKFQRTNTVALGGVPTNDPPLFEASSMIVTLEGAKEVEVVFSAKGLTVKKR
ncbi:hypothetical protein [Zavarzinia sp.]|uniref:hypothetical protein n=1 Tax=Zavarzinia sp. TaxID=2027920 RepID=UPI0035625FE8